MTGSKEGKSQAQQTANERIIRKRLFLGARRHIYNKHTDRIDLLQSRGKLEEAKYQPLLEGWGS